MKQTVKKMFATADEAEVAFYDAFERANLSAMMAVWAESDDVVDTVHYGELAERLVAVISGEPVNLIETFESLTLNVVGHRFDRERTADRVRGIRNTRFKRNDLLGSERQSCRS